MILHQPDARLFYTDTSGPGSAPIVFIHGFPFNQSMWEQQVKVCQEDRRVVTYDVRGHGQSDVGDGQYIFEQFVDDLFSLMEALKMPRAILCGLSMGGYIALRAAERQPEKVLGLILCDTRSEADSPEATLKRARDLRLIRDHGVGAFADAFLKAMFSPSTFRQRLGVVDQVRQMILTNPVRGICGTLIALATRTDTTSSLGALRVPTLVVVGAEDALTPPSTARTLQERIPKSTWVEIPTAGHLSNLENPTVFNDALLTFLKRQFT